MAFARPTSLRMSRITTIFGKNNSGKTTLARLPIMVAASLISEDFYTLESRGIIFGSSFAELASVDQPHPRISLSVAWDGGQALSFVLQHIASSDGRERVELVAVGMDGAGFYSSGLGGVGSVTQPRQILDSSAGGSFRTRQKAVRELLEGIIHIPSARPPIESTYKSRDPKGPVVVEVPYLLASDGVLMDVTSRWFRDDLGVGEISVDKAAFAFRLTGREMGYPVNLASSGRGIQSVLPVATILRGIATRRIAARLVIIEEPEVHLHPSAHGAVADLVIAASSQCQVLVETHSENFVLRLRRRISDAQLSPDDLSLLYLDSDHRVIRVLIDRFGGASNWPHGVFESDVAEAEAIVQAKIAAMGSAEVGECFRVG